MKVASRLVAFAVLPAALTLQLTTPAAAAEPAATPPPAATSVDKAYVKQRAKVEAANAKLKAEHQELDRTISRIVDIVVSLRDSRQSGTAALKIKEDVGKELGGLIRFYEAERTRIREQLKTETSPAARALWEQQLADSGRLVEKRIDQIISIVESLSVYTDDANLKKSEDSTISPVAANRAERIGDKVRDALQDDLQRLRQENDELQRQLDRAGSDRNREELGKRIAANKELIDRREEQIKQAVTGKAGGQTAAKRGTLYDYGRDIRAAMKELRQRYEAVLKLKQAADKERRALALLEDKQAAAQGAAPAKAE